MFCWPSKLDVLVEKLVGRKTTDQSGTATSQKRGQDVLTTLDFASDRLLHVAKP